MLTTLPLISAYVALPLSAVQASCLDFRSLVRGVLAQPKDEESCTGPRSAARTSATHHNNKTPDASIIGCSFVARCRRANSSVSVCMLTRQVCRQFGQDVHISISYMYDISHIYTSSYMYDMLDVLFLWAIGE